jgi:hypothetical protein
MRRLELPGEGEGGLDTEPTTVRRRISQECLLALAALIFCCSRDCFLFDETMPSREYDRSTALARRGPGPGEIVR